ncbi:MAG: zinc-finger domain-containing protein [Pseudomonadota bacterium]
MTETLPSLPAHDAPEQEVVETTRICCDGGTLGHPRVWLQIDPAIGWVDCGYCDKRYILKRDFSAH